MKENSAQGPVYFGRAWKELRRTIIVAVIEAIVHVLYNTAMCVVCRVDRIHVLICGQIVDMS